MREFATPAFLPVRCLIPFLLIRLLLLLPRATGPRKTGPAPCAAAIVISLARCPHCHLPPDRPTQRLHRLEQVQHWARTQQGSDWSRRGGYHLPGQKLLRVSAFCRHSSCHLPLSLLSRGHAFRPPGSRQQVTSAEGTGCDLPALTATPRPLLRIPPDPASQMLPFLSNEDESHLQKLTSTKPFPRTKCAPDTRLSAFNVFSLNFTKALG